MALLMLGSLSAQTQWTVDPAHTTIGFTVEHLVISEVDGKFKEFDLTVASPSEDWEGSEINFSAKASSIDTDNEKRDGHLQSPDFFNAEAYPELTFESTAFEKIDDETFKLVGNLTMHGVTKKVELEAKHRGTVKDPWGNTKVGWVVNGILNRTDFGLEWNKALESGGLLVGETVNLNINLQLQKAG